MEQHCRLQGLRPVYHHGLLFRGGGGGVLLLLLLDGLLRRLFGNRMWRLGRLGLLRRGRLVRMDCRWLERLLLGKGILIGGLKILLVRMPFHRLIEPEISPVLRCEVRRRYRWVRGMLFLPLQVQSLQFVGILSLRACRIEFY